MKSHQLIFRQAVMGKNDEFDNSVSDKDLKDIQSNNIMIKHYIGILIIGALNNLPYWVAISSAQSIVIHFKSEGMLGAITWACVLLGMAATSVNTFLSSKNVSYNIRAVANGCFMGFGLIGTAFAPNIYVAMIGIMFVGLSSDFGEGVMLGYFASINDNSLMGAWGVGTGISGILGAGYSFLCQFFKINYFISFLSISPSGLFYPLAFILLLDAKSPSKEAKSRNEPINHDLDQELNSIAELDVIPNDIEEEEKKDPEENVKWCSLKLWKFTAYFFINNAITFFSQYASISGTIDCSMTAQEKIDQPYIYGLLSLIYQIGNMCGRSSLKFFKIRRIWILTLLQFIFFAILFVNIQFKLLPIWGKIVMMILIGVNSGLSYVNLFNQVMNYPQATIKEREIMTNLTTISIASFIVVSSAFTLLYQNTFYKEQCVN